MSNLFIVAEWCFWNASAQSQHDVRVRWYISSAVCTKISKRHERLRKRLKHTWRTYGTMPRFFSFRAAGICNSDWPRAPGMRQQRTQSRTRARMGSVSQLVRWLSLESIDLATSKMYQIGTGTSSPGTRPSLRAHARWVRRTLERSRRGSRKIRASAVAKRWLASYKPIIITPTPK